MAKFRSHLFSVIRGSVGGATYSSNAANSNILRKRTVPKNNLSTARVLTRLDLSDSSKAWQDLSLSKRNLWNQYALQMSRSGSLPRKNATGRHLAIAQYSASLRLFRADPAMIAFGPSMDPPTLPGHPTFNVFNIRIFSGAPVGVVFNVTNLSSIVQTMYVYRSGPVSPSSLHVPRRFLPETLDINFTSPGIDIIYFFSGMISGRRYHFKIRGIDRSPGRRLSAFTYFSFVAG